MKKMLLALMVVFMTIMPTVSAMAGGPQNYLCTIDRPHCGPKGH